MHRPIACPARLGCRALDRRAEGPGRGPAGARPGRLRWLAGAALLLIGTSITGAATYTVSAVDDTNDGSCTLVHCSLREAITLANAAAGPHVIDFAIPDTPPHRIQPTGSLPALTRSEVLIDGYAQPGASPNTDPALSNATIAIELDGALSGNSATGLTLNGNGIAVRGLAIHGFEVENLRVNGIDTTIAGCYFGTDAGGRDLVGGSDTGNHVQVSASGAATIGGPLPADRNVFGGARYAVRLSPNSGPSLVANNLFGLSADGSIEIGQVLGAMIVLGADDSEIRGNVVAGSAGQALLAGNGSQRLLVDGNRFGVDPLGDGATLGRVPFGNGLGNNIQSLDIRSGVVDSVLSNNVIGYSGTDAIYIIDSSTRGIRLSGNVLLNNDGLGIDLGTSGPNPNDPGDLDAGANDLQNFPLLGSVVETASTWVVAGALNSRPGRDYRIDLYGADACDPGGHGEALAAIAAYTVTTDAAGDALIDRVVAGGGGGAARIAVLSATATDLVTGDTSELSPCVPVAGSVNGGFVRIVARVYTANEFAAPVAIGVERFGGSAGPASVRLRAEPGTARSGIDYSALDAEVNWLDGEAGIRIVPFDVIDDTEVEATEIANLRLTDPVGARFGSLSGAFVRIVQALPDLILREGFEN